MSEKKANVKATIGSARINVSAQSLHMSRQLGLGRINILNAVRQAMAFEGARRGKRTRHRF